MIMIRFPYQLGEALKRVRLARRGRSRWGRRCKWEAPLAARSPSEVVERSHAGTFLTSLIFTDMSLSETAGSFVRLFTAVRGRHVCYGDSNNDSRARTNKLAPQRSMLAVRLSGGDAVEQHMRQQTTGNQATLRLLLQHGLSSAKHETGGDHSRMAETGNMAKNWLACEEEGRLSRASSDGSMAEMAGAKAPPIVDEVLSSFGQPLNPAMRAFFKTRFGHDLSRVRVHTDEREARSARDIRALAYTVGWDIAFAQSPYAAESRLGLPLLAHELSHVVQQERLSGSRQSALQNSPNRRLCGARGRQHGCANQQGTAGYSNGSGQPSDSAPGVRKSPEPTGRLELLVDAFESVTYSVGCRNVRYGLSQWMTVRYSGNTSVDVRIDSIDDAEVSPVDYASLFDHQGEGGPVYPKMMDKGTTPRLWAAKQEVIKIMDDWNTLSTNEDHKMPKTGQALKSTERPNSLQLKDLLTY
jgi:hypothetical protein